MEFSQSFSLGETTLNQLDVFERKVPRINQNVINNHPIIPANTKREPNSSNVNSTSTDLRAHTPTVDELDTLDVIDESPTEKTNSLGQSIRERLKQASTSKKRERTHIRRSRSDPITTTDSKRSNFSSICQKQVFTEDFGLIFENTVEWDVPNEDTRKKSNIKLDEKFEEDDFDKYFEDIQTPMAQTKFNGNTTKNSSLIVLSDNGEVEHGYISEIERLMKTDKDQTSNICKTDDDDIQILELLLTKILYCSHKLDINFRIVAMSATLPNSELVRNWLKAQFYITNYRPIELNEMIKIGNDIFDSSLNIIRTISRDEFIAIENDQDNIAQLCIETIIIGAAVIVFCPSKDWCESLAVHIAQNIYKLGKSQTPIGEKIRREINLPMIEEMKGHLRNSPAGLDSILEKTISYAVAFHHAGLTFDERDIIESAFCKSTLRVIVATSTLSSGVNLPDRRVIIRSPMFGGKPMCSLTYKQMIGRAGRMGKDTAGDSILICAKSNARTGQELIGATLKPITSCLSADNHTHLKRALLEIIASGVATTRIELEAFVKCTLYHSEHQFEIKYFDQVLEEYQTKTQTKKISLKTANDDDPNDLDLIGKCMRYLERYEFIRLQFDEEIQDLKFISTRLGYACLASSMPPADGFFLFSELQKARQNFVIETELHAVYLVTPFSVCYQLQEIDWLFYLDTWEKLSNSMQRVGELVGVKMDANQPEEKIYEQKPKYKRRILLDEQVLTPSKRRNHGRAMESICLEESSNETSDVDSVILDNSSTFYNDENEDFIKQLQIECDCTVLAKDEYNSYPRLRIIDVCKSNSEFNHFTDSFSKLTICGLSLATARLDVSIPMQTYKCVISNEFYICGLAFSFEDKYVVHFLNLQNVENHIDFKKKIEFIRSIDAKNQLKTLMMAIREIDRIDCSLEDPQLAQWLIQPEEDRSFRKLELIVQYFRRRNNSNDYTKNTVNLLNKASIKSSVTRHILAEQTRILKKMGNGSIYKAFIEMEMPVQKSLIHMEQTGMALDRNALDILIEKISDHVGELEAEIFRQNGKRFAVSSSRQVAQALKILKKNGALSAKCTRAQLIQSKNPMAKLILEHRSLHAILSKSIQPLIKKTSENNRIYGNSYSFTQTGRISMHEPNLQNVAKDFQTEFKPQVFSCRSAFKLTANRMLISADFCQLELRVLAHLSEDDGLLNIFKTLNDVFISIAAKWNKVPELDVTEKMRNDTKQICYGIIYGMGIKSLAVTMKCDEEEAASLHESFHQTYPGIRNYTQKVLNFVREKGYVETIAGRRRYIPDINANQNPRKRTQAERQAINTTIQGSAADIAKYAILRMERNLIKYKDALQTDPNDRINGIYLVLHLHDELMYEVPAGKANQVIKLLKKSMENCAKLSVPLRVKVKKGQCWGSMKRIEL